MRNFEDKIRRKDVQGIVKAFSGERVSSLFQNFNTNITNSVAKIISPSVGIDKHVALENIKTDYDDFFQYITDWICAIRILNEFNEANPGAQYNTWHVGTITPHEKIYATRIEYKIDGDGTDIYGVAENLTVFGFSTKTKPATNYSKGRYIYIFK